MSVCSSAVFSSIIEENVDKFIKSLELYDELTGSLSSFGWNFVYKYHNSNVIVREIKSNRNFTYALIEKCARESSKHDYMFNPISNEYYDYDRNQKENCIPCYIHNELDLLVHHGLYSKISENFKQLNSLRDYDNIYNNKYLQKLCYLIALYLRTLPEEERKTLTMKDFLSLTSLKVSDLNPELFV